MNTEEIPKKCTVNSFFFFSSLLPFCYFSLFPVHVFGWIRHLWPAVPMSPVQSCDLPPWHSSTVQVKALSKSFWGPQAEHGRLCFFPGVLTSPSCWKYCSSLLISHLPYFQGRQIKQSTAQRAYGWEQGQNVSSVYTARGAEAVSSSHKGCKTQQGGSPAEPDLQTACSHLNSSQSFCYPAQ